MKILSEAEIYEIYNESFEKINEGFKVNYDYERERMNEYYKLIEKLSVEDEINNIIDYTKKSIINLVMNNLIKEIKRINDSKDGIKIIFDRGIFRLLSKILRKKLTFEIALHEHSFGKKEILSEDKFAQDLYYILEEIVENAEKCEVFFHGILHMKDKLSGERYTYNSLQYCILGFNKLAGQLKDQKLDAQKIKLFMNIIEKFNALMIYKKGKIYIDIHDVIHDEEKEHIKDSMENVVLVYSKLFDKDYLYGTCIFECLVHFYIRKILNDLNLPFYSCINLLAEFKDERELKSEYDSIFLLDMGKFERKLIVIEAKSTYQRLEEEDKEKLLKIVEEAEEAGIDCLAYVVTPPNNEIETHDKFKILPINKLKEVLHKDITTILINKNQPSTI